YLRAHRKQCRSGGSVENAWNGGVRLAWERLGDPTGRPLLLIMGFAMQRQFWPDDLCAAFGAAGFDVVRFDNRDVGDSTHLDSEPAPSMAATLCVPRLVAPYRLSDMAADARAVIRAAGWSSAHVAGVSMGAMIA